MATPATVVTQRNGILWLGVVVAALAFGSFLLFFVPTAGQKTLPWVNLVLSVFALLLVVAGLRRAIAQPQRYRGKIAAWVATVFSVLLLAFNTFAFYVSRHLPDPSAAPNVGQKAPDFELKDTNSQPVSLAQLLAEPGVPGKSAPTKAVLLVFYRGYW